MSRRPDLQGGSHEVIAVHTERLMGQLSEMMASEFQPRVEAIGENIISIAELEQRKPE
jgi:hypothetical protein